MKLKTNPRVAEHRRAIHGGPFSVPRVNRGVIDFSSNVNPLGPPPAAACDRDSLGSYPDPDSAELVMDLQEYTGVPRRRIVVGAGATELIYNFCRAFVLEGMPVLIPAPTFGEYEVACRLSGARIIHHKTMDAAGDIDGIISRIPQGGCVFLCNPNNPTGGLVRRSEMQRVVRAARARNTLVFLDECFIEMVPDSDESLLPATGYGNLFVLRSLTKSFGLAGARVGYGIGSRQMASILNGIKMPWSVSGPAQRAASAVLSDPSHLERTRRLIGTESAFLRECISGIEGFRCCNSAANFILIRTELDPGILQEKLLARGILVRDCSSFPGLDGRYIRVAVRTRRENEALVEALSSV